MVVVGYSVKRKNMSAYDSGDAAPSDAEVRRILDRHWDEYDEFTEEHPVLATYGQMGEDEVDVDALYEGLFEDTGDAYEELVDVAEDWEDMLDNHAVAEGYEL